MKITPEVLERYGADLKFEDGIDSMEFLEAICTMKFPMSFYHYIRNYYRLSETELGTYYLFCNIENCNNFWNCQFIKGSENLYNSYNITDSKFVRDSSHIYYSSDIYNSIDVRYGTDIAHSRHIKNSNRIIESQNITDSNDVGRSNNIAWSSVILNSNYLNDCSYTYMSQVSTDCHFCGFMKNSRHCMFCTGLEDKEYYIFNKPVNQSQFEMIKEKLMVMLEEETSKMIKVNKSKHTSEERFRLNRRFDSIINGLSKEFFGWVGTLPNYSDDVYMDIFFRDRETKTVEK